MANEIDDGGPAFPVIVEGGEMSGLHPSFDSGMSLRDAFAIGAASGHLASMNPGSIDQGMATHIARSAYMVADAMLAARKPKGDQHG
jgi:hypothetical protein